MIRTQIQLTAEQHRNLKRWASRQGISMAEAVRRCVEERVAQEPEDQESLQHRVREALLVVGRYSSGLSDVAARHDDYLADTYGS
jgi:hypothetical protein